MIRIQYFCDLCNPSLQVRDETHEVKYGYAEIDVADNVGGDTTPPDWEIVADIPRTGTPGWACPRCIGLIEKGIHSAQANARSGSPAPTTADGWPAKASPFQNV